jgi:hypothetical protein
VAWVIDGKQGQPLLERREKWVTEDGSEKLGKSKGMTASDYWILLENRDEIGRIMGIPARKIMEIASGSGPSSETPSNSTQNPQSDTPMMASANEETLVGAETGVQESDPWK